MYNFSISLSKVKPGGSIFIGRGKIKGGTAQKKHGIAPSDFSSGKTSTAAKSVWIQKDFMKDDGKDASQPALLGDSRSLCGVAQEIMYKKRISYLWNPFIVS